MLRPLPTLALSLTPMVVACGGATASREAGADAGVLSDASSAADVRATSPCPADAPVATSRCSIENTECEYGVTTTPCTTLARCEAGNASGLLWVVSSPPMEACLAATAIGGSGECPASFAGVPRAASCFVDPGICRYPEGMCACATVDGVVTPGAREGRWICEDATLDCPHPRPLLGTLCAQENQTCTYAPCSGIGSWVEKCLNGVWQIDPDNSACLL